MMTPWRGGWTAGGCGAGGGPAVSGGRDLGGCLDRARATDLPAQAGFRLHGKGLRLRR